MAHSPAGAEPRGFEGVRLTVTEAQDALTAAADRIAAPRSLWSRTPFEILAVSGGAAGGAFGAGILVGLSRAGRRPNFAIVTGVSTGALIAPFAFLGSAWDERLTEAYTGGHAARLLTLRKAIPGLGGLLRAESMDALIAPFVDEDLLLAVARAHAEGRRLFVATTDLDRQQACIWDMGAIASYARPGDSDAALKLFRDVLAASASLPGLFPPRLIASRADDEDFEEMHVDGGVAAPLFILPEALLRDRNIGRRFRGGRVRVIVNTVLDPAPRTTPSNLPAILMRSFDTMLRFSYRQAISVAATFCAGAGVPLEIASIPYDPNHGSMVKFDTDSMRRMFDAAVASVAEGKAWVTATPEPATLSGMFSRSFRPGKPAPV
nr:patatin-like phospholipase family protein [Caulobacter sp. NIBR2454]